MTGIEGKIVAITGASGGIGEAAARRLAALGAKVMIGARRVDRIEAIAADIARAGGSVRWRRVDVTDRYNTQAFVSAAHAWNGRLDVLVNAAGATTPSAFESLDIDAWDRMIDVNLRGVLHGIAAVLPLMQAQRGGGQIVNIAATADAALTAGAAVHGATASGVRAISQGLRLEAGDDVRVTVVSPGTHRCTLVEAIADRELRRAMAGRQASAPSASSIAEAIAYVIAQPPDVDVGEVVMAPARRSPRPPDVPRARPARVAWDNRPRSEPDRRWHTGRKAVLEEGPDCTGQRSR